MVSDNCTQNVRFGLFVTNSDRKMKFFAFAAFALLLSSSVAAFNADLFKVGLKNVPGIDKYAFESEIRELLENLRFLLKNGDPEKGIPPLEPLPIPHFDFDFVLRESILTGYIGEIKGYNFSDYVINNVKFDVIKIELEIDLSWPILILDGGYKVVGNLFEDPLNGEGTFLSTTEDLNVRLFVKLGSNLVSSQIKELDVSFSCDKDDIVYSNSLTDETGLHLDDKFLQERLNRIQTEYFPLLLNTLRLVGSDLIHDIPLQEIVSIIIGIISGGNGYIARYLETVFAQ